MWALLVALALAPTVAMAGFAWRDVQRSADEVREAEAAEQQVLLVLELQRLNHAVPMEHVPSQALVEAGEFGLSEAQAAEVLGFDLREELARTRADTDRLLEELSPVLRARAPLVTEMGEELSLARGLVDAAAAPAEVNRAYLALTAQVATVAQRETLALRASLGALGSIAVDDSVALLADAVDLADAGMDEIWALADTLLGGGDLTSTQRLIAAAARFERAEAAVARRSGVDGIDSWPTLLDSAGYRAMRQAVAGATDGTSPLQADRLEEVGAVFAASFDRAERLADVVEDVGAATSRNLRSAAWEAELSRRRTAAATAGLVLLTLGLAVGVSLAITRPLGRLASGARAVSEGNLDDATFGSGGPREIDVVSAALDEVVVNLRRIEAQAEALARGDLEDGVLASTVPNALGESLHRSVVQLSRSMRAQEDLRYQLSRQAVIDPLTQLLNRAGSIDAIEKALARSERTGQLVGLLYVDLDGFKRTNDDHGHSVGDEVLRQIAIRLSEVVRAGDVVGRLGGDEFVIVAESVSEAEDMVRLGERVVEVVCEPVDVDGSRSQVGASIGVAFTTGSEGSALDLLQQADHAVYRAKRSGRRRVEVFDDALKSEIAARVSTEADLRTALVRNELVLHYQPVVDAQTLQLRSFEALVRWHRPGHGLVGPLSFISVAESSDLIVELGRWVLGEAAAQMARWSGEDAMRGVGIAVNLSGRHFLHASVVSDVTAALAAGGLDPSLLTLEITETVVLSDNVTLLEHVEELRSMGVRLAIDDFGTGYTSMSQLGRLPVDVLKIDQAYVAAMSNGSDRSVVELTVGVGHTLGLELIAEGVEERAQLEVLRTLGCDAVQGFLISPPLEPDAVLEWVRAHGSQAAPMVDDITS